MSDTKSYGPQSPRPGSGARQARQSWSGDREEDVMGDRQSQRGVDEELKQVGRLRDSRENTGTKPLHAIEVPFRDEILGDADDVTLRVWADAVDVPDPDSLTRGELIIAIKARQHSPQ